MNKYIFIVLIILAVGLSVYSPFFQNNNKINCAEFGVIHITPDETHYTQSILKENPNIIVKTPELNRVVGENAALECGNFDFYGYIANELNLKENN